MVSSSTSFNFCNLFLCTYQSSLLLRYYLPVQTECSAKPYQSLRVFCNISHAWISLARDESSISGTLSISISVSNSFLDYWLEVSVVKN